MDLLRFCASAVLAHRLRTGLSTLGIAIGIAAVILLTTIGEGTRGYVLKQFSQFGTNVLGVVPGKTETAGLPGVFGGTTHKLTIDDAEALRRIPGVEQVVPVSVGQARVEVGSRGRSVFVFGVNHEMPAVWRFTIGHGTFIPAGDPRRGASVAVLGATLKRELFQDQNALGQVVRIGGTRLRVIGVMAPKGRVLGFDIDDAAYIPVSTAMRLFNMEELNEIDVVFSHGRESEQVAKAVTQVLTERHRGHEDFTVTTQDAMLDVFGKVMDAVTMAMGAIGAISLLVGAIGILTMMWISVGERTREIGLLRALGGTSGQILRLFLIEAVLLALLGGALGIGIGLGTAALLRALLPGVPLATPPEYLIAAVVVSVVTGLLAGVLPARRAAEIDPLEALRAE